MAVNRINPIEQHIEKVVVAIGGAALLGVLAMQFVGGSTSITIDKAQVPIEQAFTKVGDEATRLKGEIASEQVPLPPPVGEGGLLTDFKKTYAGPVAGKPVALAAGAFERYKNLPGGDFAQSSVGSEAPYNLPAIPAVTGVTAHTFMSTIAKSEVDAHPDLAKFLPTQEPFDKAAVSVEGRFDGTALQAALALKPDGDKRPLPRSWWESQTAILKVELIREVQAADGTWGERTTIQPAPARDTVAAALAAATDATALGEVVSSAIQQEELVQRPAWYERPTIAGMVIGDEWQPPVEALAALENSEGASTLASAKRQLVGAIAARDRAKKRLDDMQKAAPAGAGSGPRSAPQQPGRSGGGGGGGGGSRSPAPTPTATAPTKGEITQQERIVKDLDDRVKQLQEKVVSLGGTVSDPTKPADPATGRAKPPVEKTASTLLSDASVRVWAHDLTVERGKAYRYAVQLLITNPLYARTSVPASQADATTKPVLASTQSEWSEPVRVDDEVMMFVTSAQDRESGAGGTRGAQASAELYAFSWGYWRRNGVSLQPGDSPATDVKVPDMAKIAAMAAEKAEKPASTDPKAKDATPKAEALPTRNLRISKDVVLLDAVQQIDTSTGPVASRAPVFAAYVRDGDGRVQLRLPEKERSADAYKRLKNSATAGEQALQPKVEPKAPPTKKEETPRGPRQPAGGGGGGGGISG